MGVQEQLSGRVTPLCELAEKYGTDKLGAYTPLYHLLLGHRRDEIRNVLEIGIGTPEAMPHVKGYKAGASLRMWRDYLPNATIYGLDINRDAIAAANEPPRIITTIVPSISTRFDLIVDDGSHDPEDQLHYFDVLKHSMASDGLYIIEDVDDACKLSPYLPEHTVIHHHHAGLTGKAILVCK